MLTPPTSNQIVTRFAPSPTGYLHIGHAYSAILAFRAAESLGGRFLLRIEDIDQERSRPEFVDAIFEDLVWLGLEWGAPVRHQSDHFDEYRAILETLDAAGLLYPCFCSRKDILAEIALADAAPQGPEGPVYPGICRRLAEGERRRRVAAGEPHAIRLDVVAASAATGDLEWLDRRGGIQAAKPEIFGDVVLARRDTPSSYHLAVSLDDHVQGINLVVRGKDLFASTHVHRLLQALLGLSTPIYDHHDLLTDASGRRYAKRNRSLTIRSLRQAGKSPTEVKVLAGLSAEIQT